MGWIVHESVRKRGAPVKQGVTSYVKPGAAGAKITVTLFSDILDLLEWKKGDTVAVARGTDEDMGWVALIRVQGKGYALSRPSPRSSALRLVFTAWDGVKDEKVKAEPCTYENVTLQLDGESRKGLKVRLPAWAGRPPQRFQDVDRRTLAKEPIGGGKPARPVNTGSTGVSDVYGG